jgi:hypothetical protein
MSKKDGPNNAIFSLINNNNMGTLVKFYKHHHDEELKHANIDLAHYNALLTVLKKQIPDLEITITSIAGLLANPPEFAFDMVVGDNPLTIAGAKVNKKKAMEFIELPDCWKLVIKAAEKLNKDFSENPVHKNGVYHAGNGALDRLSLSNLKVENNQLILSAEFTKSLTDKHSLYTQNEKQEKLYKLYQSICNSVIELHKLGVPFNDDLSLYEIGFIKQGSHSEGFTFSFEPTIIKHYR